MIAMSSRSGRSTSRSLPSHPSRSACTRSVADELSRSVSARRRSRAASSRSRCAPGPAGAVGVTSSSGQPGVRAERRVGVGDLAEACVGFVKAPKRRGEQGEIVGRRAQPRWPAVDELAAIGLEHPVERLRARPVGEMCARDAGQRRDAEGRPVVGSSARSSRMSTSKRPRASSTRPTSQSVTTCVASVSSGADRLPSNARAASRLIALCAERRKLGRSPSSAPCRNRMTKIWMADHAAASG